MPSFILSTYARNALANATGLNTMLSNGNMKTYDGVAPGPDAAANGTLLVTHVLPAGAGANITGGVLTLDTIANANGVANGNAVYVRFLNNGDANVIAEADAGTTGTTVIFDNTNIATDQVVSVTSANFTVPAGT